MKVLLIAIALWASTHSFAQKNDSFSGICSVASTTKTSGPEGLADAKPVTPERFYAVSGDSQHFRIELDGKSKRYEFDSLEGEFGQKKSMIAYADGKDEAVIFFRSEDGKPPIFHMEFSDGRPNTWGTCALSFRSKITPMTYSIGEMVYEKLKKEDYIKSNRVTTSGELHACELDFQHVYKDVRALSGMPVLLTGSFSIRTMVERPIAFLLKVNAASMDFSTMGWKVMKPQFTNIVVAGRNFLQNYSNEFTCETGGRCAVYQDPKWELYASVLLKPIFDGEISISLEKGGMDYAFVLSELMPRATGVREQRKFHDCALELAKKR